MIVMTPCWPQGEGKRLEAELFEQHGVRTLGDLKAAEPASCPGCGTTCDQCFADLFAYGFDQHGVKMISEVLSFVQEVSHP